MWMTSFISTAIWVFAVTFPSISTAAFCLLGMNLCSYQAATAYQFPKLFCRSARCSSAASSARLIDSKRSYKNEGATTSQDEVEDIFTSSANQRRRDATQFGILGMTVKSRAGKHPKIAVSNVDELRRAVLDNGHALSQVELTSQLESAVKNQVESTLLQNHSVLRLMKERFEKGSKPGQRLDNSTLALAIEGGGMRGCVSAGMAAAIASLGLTDTIDKIYGSSAGSVVGSYMVSRQMCLDVYVDILPAAKKLFVCKRRLVKGLARSLVDVLKGAIRNVSTSTSSTSPGRRIEDTTPGMNISFVLDSIMGQDHGIRPLDLEKFEENNAHQQLRVVSSGVDEEGHLVTRCFGTEDFYGDTMTRGADGRRDGLFACLQASMTVPAATGPPVELISSTGDGSNTTKSITCFDAFCFEPIPYRSAVEEGATHVLTLASKPLGFQPKTKPGLYETALAPLYFYSHGQSKVAKFFENGGQQYLYAEDILTLQEAKQKFDEPVPVPPAKILYGLDNEHEQLQRSAWKSQGDETWKKAHLFPLQVPPGTPELGTLEQSKYAVLGAVRGGYSVAFDLLAPIVGIENHEISGKEVAELVFPDVDSIEQENDWFIPRNLDKILLETKIHVPGEAIVLEDDSKLQGDDIVFSGMRGTTTLSASQQRVPLDLSLSHTLLSKLPGFQGGRLHHLSKGLKYKSGLHLDHFPQESSPSSQSDAADL